MNPLRSTRSIPGPLLVALTVIAVLCAGCSSDTTSDSSEDSQPTESMTLTPEVTKRLAALVDGSLGTPGGTVGVFIGDDEWIEVAGDASIPGSGAEEAPGVEPVTQAEPVTADMVWPLRSITKSFTVTLLLQLVDEGLVALDEPISKYVPTIPNGEATLEQLADMTSGVPEYTNQGWVDVFSADPLEDFTGKELIGFAAGEPPLFAPGAEHVYTNTNTVLLGQVIEQVTGKSFDEVLTERILEPLDLADTVYPAGVTDWNGPHGTGYQLDEGKLMAQPVNFSVFDTAGAMISNVGDLHVWGEALATGSLISEESQAERTDVATPLDEGPEYDSYGMGIGEIDGWWGHTGEGMGFEALVMHDAESDATVVIYVNLSNVIDDETGEPVHVPTSLFRQIVDILEGGGS